MQETQANCAFPEELRAAEAAVVRMRPKWTSKEADETSRVFVGIGLSGGGIRSATFCLGIFQALARAGKLREIDYLSTVSGGGYFGSAFGRVFGRKEITSPKEIDAALGSVPESPIIAWLRENGRFLAPRGGGDFLLALAGTVRNWVSVQLLLSVLVLAVFCLLQLGRYGIVASLDQGSVYLQNLEWPLPGGLVLWGSVYSAVPVAVLLLTALPLGWAYWVLPSDGPGSRPSWSAGVGMLLVIVAGLYYPRLHGAGDTATMAGHLAAAIAALSLVVAIVSLAFVRFRAIGKLFVDAEVPEDDHRQLRARLVRHKLTRWLQQCLTVVAVTAVFVLIDSIGQTLYADALIARDRIGKAFGAILAVLGAIAAAGARIAPLLGRDGKPAPKKGLIPLAATAVAASVVFVLLLGADLLSHGIAWQFDCPTGVPCVISKSPESSPPSDEAALQFNCPADAPCVVSKTPSPANPCPTGGSCDAIDASPATQRLHGLYFATGFLFFLAVACSHAFAFLNSSSQLPLYQSRLARAYLGASNSRRHKDGLGHSVLEVIPKDDQAIETYYQLEDKNARKVLYGKGAPLHLINVTINETISGESQVEQQDRKGLALAVGPCGLSAGARHHVLVDGTVRIFPESNKYRVFNYDETALSPGVFPGQRMSLGRWIAISGAAFSTGTGYQTSLSLSLLAGLGNIRLGYWWDAYDGLKRQASAGRRRKIVRRAITWILPVHAYLFDELLARFRGVSDNRWCLTDGGHFENLAGYELIRRRVPMIILIDSEADPEFQFSGLSDLITKARVDFHAEIEILTKEQLDETVDAEVRSLFGTLDDLRPKASTSGHAKPLSQCHAALARIRYLDGSEFAPSFLVYIKASVVGDEPFDVVQYHRQHETFPHESTADQFFDERQWESYRMLGEHVGKTLFDFEKPAKGWRPDSFVPPPVA